MVVYENEKKTGHVARILPDVTRPHVPPLILMNSGQRAIRVYNEFLDFYLVSDATRATYKKTLSIFFRHFDKLSISTIHELNAQDLQSITDYHLKKLNKPSMAKLIFSAGKSLFLYYEDRGVIERSPFHRVNYKFPQSRIGKTQVISPEDINRIISSIDCGENALQTDLRDRALIALMAYCFVRIGGALSIRIKDYKEQGGEKWLTLIEKGAKPHSLPITSPLSNYLDEYITRCNIFDQDAYIFQSANRNSVLTGKPYNAQNSCGMVKRRAENLGIKVKVTNHTFRASGITSFLQNGGRIEDAQDIANHSSIDTTRLYDRRPRDRLLKIMSAIYY